MIRSPAQWLPVTVSVLVVSCPCALALATPAAIAAATSRLLARGVLLTRDRATETLARVDTVIFDKTGTLTDGTLRLTEVVPLGSAPAAQCLRQAAALEQFSEHPVARAIAAAVGDAGLPVATKVKAHTGGGITGVVNGLALTLGSPDFVRAQAGPDAGLPAPDSDDITRAWLAAQGGLLADFRFDDKLRAGAASVIDRLHEAGMRTLLLSGDAEGPARRVAGAVGIDDVAAGMSPQGKLELVRSRSRTGQVVAMVGDGVNDAPVLAGADVSFAVAGAAPLASVSADIVLVRESLDGVAEALETAGRALGIVRQNLAWALAYNLLAVPAASMGWVAPLAAAAGMSLSSLIVVVNALRLRGRLRTDGESPDRKSDPS